MSLDIVVWVLMHAKKMCIMCNKRGFVINIHSVLRIIYHLLKTQTHVYVLITNLHSVLRIIYHLLRTQTYMYVLITNLHSVLRRIYHQVMCMYAEWCICACTQNGAYVHGRRMVHMCMDAEWCICAWTLNGALLHARRMVHFCRNA